MALALAGSGTGDYASGAPVGGDNAAPAVDALIHGQIGSLFAHQPFMGLFSILWRAPFAALASLLGGGNRTLYAAGAVACVMPAAMLALYLLRRARIRSSALWAIPAGAVLVVSPVALDAVRSGHPEEMLVCVLATAAVLAAMRERVGWAAILLGLAVGTKEWAVLAAVPVLAALPRHRLRAALAAGALAAALAATGPLVDPSAFARASDAVGGAHTANALSAWWPVGSPLAVGGAAVAPSAHRLPLGLTRSDAVLAVLTAAVAMAVAAAWHTVRRGRVVDPLALLALLGLVRCFGDPWDLNYYFLALLVPLVAWETLTLGRAPVTAMIATAATTLTFGVGLRLPPAMLDACLLLWSASIGAYLAARAFGFTGRAGSWGALEEVSAHVSPLATDM